MVAITNLLEKTSRTFALAIPLLPEPARTDVTLAYLVYRIADTLEDAENLKPSERIDALLHFEVLLETPHPGRVEAFATKWSKKNLTANHWYQELLLNTGLVLSELSRREPTIQRCIRDNARRTALGMASFLQQGETQICSLAELHRYCYFVAGIVGEMLTDIFAQRVDGFSISTEVRTSSQAFGEGLQLVNMLKDIEADAGSGRRFIPEYVDRGDIFRLARKNLTHARLYIDRLREAGAPQGYVAFIELPLQLAWATLDQLERFGPGAKVPRDQVAHILRNVQEGSLPKQVRCEQRDLEQGTSKSCTATAAIAAT